MKQRTEINIELSEIIAYGRPGERIEAQCIECDSNVEMAAPQVAAALASLTEREIFRLLEAGRIHFIESGGVFICLNSLQNAIGEK